MAISASNLKLKLTEAELGNKMMAALWDITFHSFRGRRYTIRSTFSINLVFQKKCKVYNIVIFNSVRKVFSQPLFELKLKLTLSLLLLFRVVGWVAKWVAGES